MRLGASADKDLPQPTPPHILAPAPPLRRRPSAPGEGKKEKKSEGAVDVATATRVLVRLVTMTSSWSSPRRRSVRGCGTAMRGALRSAHIMHDGGWGSSSAAAAARRTLCSARCSTACRCSSAPRAGAARGWRHRGRLAAARGLSGAVPGRQEALPQILGRRRGRHCARAAGPAECVQSAACRGGQRRCISNAAQRGSPRAAQRRAAARCGEAKQLATAPGAPSATR